MKIITLLENTRLSEEFENAHGLSLYIETRGHKILFDLGPHEALLHNAEKLGVHLEDVDTVIISHGHNDHGGALGLFLARNNKAAVYLRKTAFDGHYARSEEDYFYAGLEPGLAGSNLSKQILFTGDCLAPDEQLTIFSDVQGKRYCAEANSVLYTRRGDAFLPDDFSHEQNLIIIEDSIKVLIAGCAHRGIINILERAEALCQSEMDYVLGGFHLGNPVTGKIEDANLIEAIGEELASRRETRYFTGHCTGEAPYQLLKEKLGDRLDTLSTGKCFTLV